MTTRTDSTEAMVTQLIHRVSDLTAIVRQQGDTIVAQQEAFEELTKMVMRNATQAWQQRVIPTSNGGFQ